jgi:hypothetical protein
MRYEWTRRLILPAAGLLLVTGGPETRPVQSQSPSAGVSASASGQSRPEGITKDLRWVEVSNAVNPDEVCGPNNERLVTPAPGTTGDERTWKPVSLTVDKVGADAHAVQGVIWSQNGQHAEAGFLPTGEALPTHPTKPNRRAANVTIGDEATCFAIFGAGADGKPVILETNVTRGRTSGVPVY